MEKRLGFADRYRRVILQHVRTPTPVPMADQLRVHYETENTVADIH